MSEPEILTFSGVVVYMSNPDCVEIGDVDVIAALTNSFGWGKKGQMVIAQINDETYAGELAADQGASGYSSWTPGENSMFYVGEEDLLEKLIAREGEKITLTVGFPDKERDAP